MLGCILVKLSNGSRQYTLTIVVAQLHPGATPLLGAKLLLDDKLPIRSLRGLLYNLIAILAITIGNFEFLLLCSNGWWRIIWKNELMSHSTAAAWR